MYSFVPRSLLPSEKAVNDVAATERQGLCLSCLPQDKVSSFGRFSAFLSACLIPW